MPTPLPVFVYGTLLPGEANYDWALAGRTSAEQPATLPHAVMYSNGGYPYVDTRPDHPGAVHGCLMHVPAEHHADVLATLDRLEGYRPGRADNHYERTVVTVHLPDGSTAQAYTYLLSDRTRPLVIGRLPVVPDGDWRLVATR